MGLLTTTMADAVGGASAVNGNMDGQSSSYASKFNLAPHFIGGNELSQAAPSSVKDFVAANDGHTVITNVSDRLLQGPPEASKTLQRPLETPMQASTHTDELSVGPDCKQRYRRRQGDQIRPKMGVRDLWRRARHPIHRHGHP
jgi:hypothetical protein